MARNTPVVTTVFGVLNIVVGALGLIGGWVYPFGSVMDLLERQVSMLTVWWAVRDCLRLLAAGALVFAGAGLLRVRPWGRWVSIGYAILTVALLIGSAIQTGLLQAPVDALLMAATELPGTSVQLAYAVLLLVTMLHPSTAGALKEPTGQGPKS